MYLNPLKENISNSYFSLLCKNLLWSKMNFSKSTQKIKWNFSLSIINFLIKKSSITSTLISDKALSVLLSVLSKNGKKPKTWKMKSTLTLNKTTFLMMKKTTLKTVTKMIASLMTVKKILIMKKETKGKIKIRKINKR